MQQFPEQGERCKKQIATNYPEGIKSPVRAATAGGRYVYRVSDAFVVNPNDTWVMGRIRGRDMLTLQTCTPIPGCGRCHIVRSERV